MPPSDYNKEKPLDVDSVSGTPTVDKAQPVLLVGGDDQTTGNGDIVIDFTNVSDAQDIAVYDQNDNLLDYEIESLDTAAETGVLWVYNSWVRDGSTQAKIVYGNNSANTDRQNVTGTWNNTGQNTTSAHHLDETSGQMIDSTSNNLDSTDTVGTNFNINGQFDGGRGFDGTDDYTRVDYTNGEYDIGSNEDFTALIWFKTAGESGSGAVEGGLMYTREGSPDAGILLFVNNTDGRLALGFGGKDDGGTGHFNLDDGGDYDDDTWRLAVLKRDASQGQFSLSVDAVQTATQSEDGSYTPGNFYTLGANSTDDTSYFTGELDNARFFKGDNKSPEWIQAEFDASPKAGQVFFTQQAAESTATTNKTTADYDIAIKDTDKTHTINIDTAIQTENTETIQYDTAISQVKEITVSQDSVLQAENTLNIFQDTAIKEENKTKTVDYDTAIQQPDLTQTSDYSAAIQTEKTEAVTQDTAIKDEDKTKTVDIDVALLKTKEEASDYDTAIQKEDTEKVDADTAIQTENTEAVDYDTRIGLGRPGAVSVYINGTEIEAFTNIEIERRLNEVDTFSFQAFIEDSSDRALINEGNNVKIFEGTDTLLFKGRLTEVEYKSSFRAKCEGDGMEVKLLDRKTDRETFNNNGNQIVNSIIDYGESVEKGAVETAPQVNVRFDHDNKARAVAGVANATGFDWYIDQDLSDDFDKDYLNFVEGAGRVRLYESQDFEGGSKTPFGSGTITTNNPLKDNKSLETSNTSVKHSFKQTEKDIDIELFLENRVDNFTAGETKITFGDDQNNEVEYGSITYNKTIVSETENTGDPEEPQTQIQFDVDLKESEQIIKKLGSAVLTPGTDLNPDSGKAALQFVISDSGGNTLVSKTVEKSFSNSNDVFIQTEFSPNDYNRIPDTETVKVIIRSVPSSTGDITNPYFDLTSFRSGSTYDINFFQDYPAYSPNNNAGKNKTAFKTDSVDKEEIKINSTKEENLVTDEIEDITINTDLENDEFALEISRNTGGINKTFSAKNSLNQLNFFKITNSDNYKHNSFDTVIDNYLLKNIEDQSTRLFEIGEETMMVDRDKDRGFVANDITLLGRGDGINQLEANVFAATTQYTDTSEIITKNETGSFKVDDALKLGAQGDSLEVRVGTENMDVTISDSTTLSISNRAVNNYNNNSTEQIKHFENIRVWLVENKTQNLGPFTPEKKSTAESGSSIDTFGVKEQRETDKTIVDTSTLEKAADLELKNRFEDVFRVQIEATEPRITSKLQLGDEIIVRDLTAMDVDDNFKIVGFDIKRASSEEGTILHLANRPRRLTERLSEIESDRDTLNAHMQGATNLAPINFRDNADNSNPLIADLWVPNDAVAVNKVDVKAKRQPFRGFVKANTTSGSSDTGEYLNTVTTNVEPGATLSNPRVFADVPSAPTGSFSGAAISNQIVNRSGGQKTFDWELVNTTTNTTLDSDSWVLDDDKGRISNYNASNSEVSDGDEIEFKITNTSLDTDSNSGSHSQITVYVNSKSSHDHNLLGEQDFGIFQPSSEPDIDVDLVVDGNTVQTFTNVGVGDEIGPVDVNSSLSEPIAGEYHEIKLVPKDTGGGNNGRCRLNTDVNGKIFIESTL